jgi:ACT domain-containing protein
MKAIVTVIGKDRKGIIAKVSNFLYENEINIEDITQTIMQDYFSMVMMVNTDAISVDFTEIVKKATALGEEMGLEIRIQSEEIFNSMHKI